MFATVTAPWLVQPKLINSSIILLPDGTRVVIRPAQPEDAPRVLEMHDRCSSDSLYFRYLHPYRPTLGELALVVHMKREEGAAFVAEIQRPQPMIVALVLYRIDPHDPTVAQPAILVEDQYQGLGLGRVLMQCVRDDALVNGVSVFEGAVHSANQKMVHLVTSTGYPHDTLLAYGAYEIRVQLQRAPIDRASGANNHVPGASTGQVVSHLTE